MEQINPANTPILYFEKDLSSSCTASMIMAGYSALDLLGCEVLILSPY